MRIEWSRQEKYMTVHSKGRKRTIDCSCVVRNDINKWRPNPKKPPANEVVYAISEDNKQTKTPVMPRQFPLGRWKITTIEPRTDDYRAPFIIMTNASQPLDVWALDDAGGYKTKTEKTIVDHIYGIHYSKSNTTQGCIKITYLEDLYWLIKELKASKNAIIDVID